MYIFVVPAWEALIEITSSGGAGIGGRLGGSDLDSELSLSSDCWERLYSQ